MMNDLISRFPSQLKEAISIANNSTLSKLKNSITNVVICGLGGSGIGGTIVKEIVQDEANVPIDVMKSYALPAYVDKHTLVICSSYSGNTEETLESFTVAKERKAHIVCVTSGGKLLEEVKKNNLDSIIVPGGMPPRACLGYSLTQLLHILAFHGIAPEHSSHILNGATLIENEQADIKNEALNIAEKLSGKCPVIYSTSLNEGIAIRLRQQLNENAKILCWHHVIPEMNHNELVGWSHPYSEVAVILLRDRKEHPRNELRIQICKKTFEKYAGAIIEMHPKGNHTIEKKIYWIHLGDWVSYFLAEKRNVDAMEVKAIDQLKKDLARQ